MRTVLLIISVLLISSSNAQNMSFEETVIYINKKIKETEGDTRIANIIIKAEKNGKMTFDISGKNPQTINLFDLKTSEILKTGIYLDNTTYVGFKKGQVYSVKLSLFENRDTDFVVAEFVSEADARRLRNALDYLKTLCKKENDPFD